MFQGLRTVVYHVDDLDRAKEWYTQAAGVAPYFDQPFYVGFNVGGYELGLDPDGSGVERGTTPVAYWGVSDVEASFRQLLELGASEVSGVQDVGEGIMVASLRDPFGNVFGIIHNPHFKIENAG